MCVQIGFVGTCAGHGSDDLVLVAIARKRRDHRLARPLRAEDDRDVRSPGDGGGLGGIGAVVEHGIGVRRELTDRDLAHPPG